MTRCLSVVFALALSLSCAAQSYKEEIAAISKESRVRLNFHETKNFVWGFDGARTKVMPAIKAAERGFEIVLKMAKYSDFEPMWGRKKALMVICRNRVQYKRFIKWYGKKYNPYPGFEDVATKVAYFPQPYPRVCGVAHYNPLDEEMMVNCMVHLVGHLSMHRYRFHSNFIPPWLEEGFGVWLEATVRKKSICYCFGGSGGDSYGDKKKLENIEFKKWKQSVRGALRQGSMRHMKRVMPLRLSQLGPKDVGKAWSMIDFMIKEDPAKFMKFLEMMKAYWPSTYEYEFTDAKKDAQEKGVKKAFGKGWDEMDEAWKKYVLKAYR